MNEKMSEFKRLIEKHAKDNVPVETLVKGFYVYKSTGAKPHSEIYDAGIAILAAGKKRCSLNGRSFDYGVGNYLGVFLPIPVEVEEIDVSSENPLLMVGLKMDLGKIAEILLRIDRLEQPKTKASSSSGIFTEPLNEDLLDALIRLLKTLNSPAEIAILCEGIINEIYYRVLTGEHVAAIRNLLEQRGQIQQISRAVEHINTNLSEPVAVEDLAAKANMSVSHFHKNFKDVMQMSPLQYAKSMKLFKAQSLIQGGERASQAAFAVGYNSAAQFSREYKRQFGFAPSETLASA